MAMKNREKMLIFFALIAVAIWAFDHFYYAPQSRRLSTLREEVNAADLKLKEFTLFTKGVEAAEAEVSRLEDELKKLNERMLRGEEFRTFLRHLGRDSDRLQMKMISLTSQEEKLSLPEEKKAAPPAQYKKVTIQMVLHSTFSGLRTYLKGIEELPFLVTVDHVRVERMDERIPLLRVTMGLSVYVIS
jgi:ATP-dependent Lon protease